MVKTRKVTEEQLQYVRDNYMKYDISGFEKHFDKSRTWTYKTIQEALTPNQYEAFKQKNYKTSLGVCKFSTKHKNYLLLHCDDDFDLMKYIDDNNLSVRAVKEFCRDNGLIKAKRKRYHYDTVGRDKKEKIRRQMVREQYQIKALELCGL